jgi:hypothetical protein
MLVSSPTLSTAFFAVAVHTPPEQVTFFVAFSEMVTAACAPFAATVKIATAAAYRARTKHRPFHGPAPFFVRCSVA